MFLLLLLFNAAAAAIPNICNSTVQDPITKVFHLADSKCYDHVKKEIDSFCKGFQAFDKIPVDGTFIIAYGSSGVVYQCNGAQKAIFQHCRTPTGVIVEPEHSESYNDEGDSTFCYNKYKNSSAPLFEFNNRQGCITSYGLFIKVGQKSPDGELECRLIRKEKAQVVRLGCNTKIGFMKIGDANKVVNGTNYFCMDDCSFASGFFLADRCTSGSGQIGAGDEFTKQGGILRYRCGFRTSRVFKLGNEEFVGCISRKIMDPIKTAFIYRNGEVMQEYGQKCSANLKLTATGKESFCALNGIQYEVGTWLRVLVQSRVGHFYYCENENGKPKNVFRGCFKKDLSYIISSKLTSAQEAEQKRCVAPLKDWKKITFGARIWPN